MRVIAIAVLASCGDKGVDMIVDVPNSSVALAVQAIAKERKRILIASAAGTN